MGLSMRSRQEVSKKYAKRYQKASKGGKKEILNSFIELTGYNRCYASYIFRIRLYLNYFQPLMKLKSKERIGSKVIKKYDKPKTPYHRLLEMEEIEKSIKNELKAIYKELNPFEVKRSIEKLQKKLFKMVYLKRKRGHINWEDYEYQVPTL